MTAHHLADRPVRAPEGRAESAGAECLVCFVMDNVERSGCDNTLRWARAYRDTVAPADQGLERRLEASGGYCDCEILMNAFVPASGSDDDWPDDLPECAGVRRGSTVPCREWVAVPSGRR